METEERGVGASGTSAKQREPEDRSQRLAGQRRRVADRRCVGEEGYLVIIVGPVIDARKPDRIGWARMDERREPTEGGKHNEDSDTPEAHAPAAAAAGLSGGAGRALS
jgi:hypothetical protein